MQIEGIDNDGALDDEAKTPMRRLWLCAFGAVLGCGEPVPSPVELVDRGAYEADLTTIAAPRSPRTPRWQAVQDLCADRFAALGLDVERHAYTTGVNVIGVRPGTTKPAERANVRVIVGAAAKALDR